MTIIRIVAVTTAVQVVCGGMMAYGLAPGRPSMPTLDQKCHLTLPSQDDDGRHDHSPQSVSLPGHHRRDVLHQLVTTTAAVMVGGGIGFGTTIALPAWAEEGSMFAPTFVQEYADFIKTSQGWSYRDVTTGSGETPTVGDRAVYDWSGYTIGYFGRPFEAKGGPQGGAFDKRDVDYSRTVLGSGELVKGLESAMLTMKVGSVRQVIVPYGELSYPPDDATHERVGPKPTTFSGQRALNFVLENPRVDRTLLFNVKLVRIDKPDGRGSFKRGDKV